MLKQQLILLGKRLLLIFAIYFFARLLFLLFNYSLFQSNSLFELIKLFFFSLRFDLAAIAITNSLFIFSSLIPVKTFFTKGYQSVLKFLFLLANIPCLLFNLLDVGYYRFTLKRTTADFFGFVTVGDDLENILPKILADFWYLLLIFFVMIYIIIKLYNRINQPVNNFFVANKSKWYHWFALPIAVGLIIIAGRGGFQLKPLGILAAAKYTSSQNIALVLNTPFTIIKSLGKEELIEENYFTVDELKTNYNSIHQYKTDSAFKNLNVVVLIMESFSKEYIGYFNEGKGYTPFLDSLIKESIVCNNAYANGKRSIEGIPAILSGIPAMMNTAYLTSTYNGNSINSLPLLLKNKNYYNVFYHGGNNGTMGFDNYAKMAGYDKYVGRNEYSGNEYDGNWGIYDEPFMQFFCKGLSAITQPFHAAFFSLSSHHPYGLPIKYKTAFQEGTIPIHRTIRYSDYALQQFFLSAEKTSWYKNTLFVITADHTGPSDNVAYQNKQGMYAIPIIYFYPAGNLKGIFADATQHADIIPSVLNYINYKESFKFYGESIFDSTANHFAINFIDGVYQYISNETIVWSDGEKMIDCFNQGDKLNTSKKDTVDISCKQSEKKLKAFIQDFNFSMIHNKLTSTSLK